jgi:cytochrome c peroxidase
MKTKLLIFAVSITSILLTQCGKKISSTSQSPTLPSESYDYTAAIQTLPNAGSENNTPSYNQTTNEGATLGRVLFYDKKMSINNQVSCGSCHHQQHAFADPTAASIGFEGNKTARNSMSIVNSISQAGYFWDNRTKGLEEMVLQPVSHSVEMGMEKIDILPKKLAVIDYYKPLFEKAFGSTEITKEKISYALAQFLRSMYGKNSLADQTNLTQTWGNITDTRINPMQKRGAQVFNNVGCENCHSGKNFRGWSNQDKANIGLELVYKDKGMGETEASKEGIFKVPSLRNVELTAPYMHDGRFNTLNEVVAHYNDGVVDHPNLDSRLRNNSWGGGDNSPRKLNLTEYDQNCLVEFLKTLTDEELVKDEKFANPFLGK